MSNKLYKVVEVIFGWIDRISTYFGYVAAGLGLVITFIVTYGVFLRFLLKSPVFWVEEVSGYIFVAFFSFGIVYATLRESHVASEILLSRFPVRAQFTVTMIGYVMAFIISCAMVYYGSKTTLTYLTLDWHSSTILDVALWPVWSMIPLGFSIFALAILSRIRAITLRLITTGSIVNSNGNI